MAEDAVGPRGPTGRLAEQYRIVEHQVRMYIISSDALIGDPAELAGQHRPLNAAAAESEAVRQHTREGHKLMDHLRQVAPEGATRH